MVLFRLTEILYDQTRPAFSVATLHEMMVLSQLRPKASINAFIFISISPYNNQTLEG